MADDHEIIANLKKEVGGTFADKITDADISGGFLHMGPEERAAALMKTENWIADGDGASLRQKSQLLSISREMRALDYAMRKAGR